MQGGANISRRTLFLLLGLLRAPKSLAGLEPRAISDVFRGFTPRRAYWRRYRIDATILLLGMPVLTKQGVGGAYASVETGSSGTGEAVGLQFAAGSWPERAHGVNRFGIWREAVLETETGLPEIAFAGLITASPEETLAQARSVLASSGIPPDALVARGSLDSGTTRTWIDRIQLPRDCLWTDLSKILYDETRREPRGNAQEVATSGCVTFLQAIRAAFQSQGEARASFIHGGRAYVLETHRKLGRQLVINGVIRDRLGVRCSEFRTVYAADEESGLPIRIEYRARAFLRLTLEAESDPRQPPLPSVFEENA